MFDGKLCAILIAVCALLGSIGAFCTDDTAGDDSAPHYLLCGVVTMGTAIELAVLICWTP